MVTMFEISLWSRLVGIGQPGLTVGWLEVRCWEWLIAIRPRTRMVISEPPSEDEDDEEI